MRPLRLELKGFTAFRQTAEIDFTELDVFAISGATGSGKSSLLDAMTYALYGRVERVGDRVGQLISQGNPRMAVTLEFEIGHDRYQLTRSTSAKGATKIQLMRHVDGEWTQAGEGSDRVRDVEKILAATIGLTYDGFTRSVLLPQGRFAEFLVGEARKRRDILTELLGLSLFRRMAERAGSVAKETGDKAKWTADLLDREFADATPQSSKDARAAAKDAEDREKRLAAAAGRVLRILGRWQDAKRSAQDLRACVMEAQHAAEEASAATDELAGLSEELERSVALANLRRAGSQEAETALDVAVAALRDADRSLGLATELTKAQVEAIRLAELLDVRRKQRDASDLAADTAGDLAKAVERAQHATTERRAVLSAAEAGARAGEAALEVARHADLVTAISAGLKAGDPCPVCGAPLSRAPKRSAAGALKRAEVARDVARKRMEEAREALMGAEGAAAAAAREADANATEQQRLAAEIEELDRTIAAAREAIGVILGDPLADDPVVEIGRRLAERTRLDQAERDAERAVTDAKEALVVSEQERDKVASAIMRQRDRFMVHREPLFERAARALGDAASVSIPAIPEPGQDTDADSLRQYADRVSAALSTFAEGLGQAVDEHDALEGRLLIEAADHVDGLVEPAPSLEALAETVDSARRSAAADAATAAQRADDLAAKLARKQQLLEEVNLLHDRSRLFKALALELRADHLIAFLQAEALQLLAAAGSDRLSSLSDGRYRLICRDDEFIVADTWNGDEERSARTLSGGETFLASLALALALADQVRSLAVTDHARLDSLFLDEGFGTLDAETLRVVVDAIGQLANDGRLVGVITHVEELAEQFTRIEVRKGRAGSTLELVP